MTLPIFRPVFRPATEQDLSKMLPLFEELGYPAPHEQLSARFKRFLNNPGCGIAV